MTPSPLVKSWMSWSGGFDLVGLTQPGLPMPNLIVHLAALVHTPVGSAPAGMLLFQPDVSGAPEICCFVSPDAKVAAYFGPTIFAGTPFEQAPAVIAAIEVTTSGRTATARVKSAIFELTATLAGLDDERYHLRPASPFPPFHQAVVEANAQQATVVINGRPIAFTVPSVGISGGYGAVLSATGLYTRE